MDAIPGLLGGMGTIDLSSYIPTRELAMKMTGGAAIAYSLLSLVGHLSDGLREPLGVTGLTGAVETDPPVRDALLTVLFADNRGPRSQRCARAADACLHLCSQPAALTRNASEKWARIVKAQDAAKRCLKAARAIQRGLPRSDYGMHKEIDEHIISLEDALLEAVGNARMDAGSS
tara:strand:+ start:5676 stop:6200 length:525 start_codon:yes stop_codon:yes gene_type:complete